MSNAWVEHVRQYAKKKFYLMDVLQVCPIVKIVIKIKKNQNLIQNKINLLDQLNQKKQTLKPKETNPMYDKPIGPKPKPKPKSYYYL